MRQLAKYGLVLMGIALVEGCGKDAATAPTFTVQGRSAAARNLVGRPATAGSPTSLNLTMYGVYVSTNTDCSGAILAGGDGATAVTRDMVTNPVIFTGSPAAGTYKCLILKMSDNMVFKPNAAAAAAFPGACTAGTDATFDIHRAGETWKNLDGSNQVGTGTPTAPSADTVFIFASTVPADVTAGPIHADSNQVLPLTAAFTIPATGSYTATFTSDFNDKVSSNSGKCWLEGGALTITGS